MEDTPTSPLSGTFGTVSLCEGIATKKYHDGLSTHTIVEMATMACLHHPFLMPSLTAFRAGSQYYVAMPMGVALDQIDSWTPQQGERWACEVLDALCFLHSMNVIHGDIKGNNIVIVDDHALLADFGGSVWDVGQHKLPACPEEFRAPEMQGKSSTFTVAADMYAFGVVFEALMMDHMTTSYKAVVQGCKETDPTKRMTARQALQCLSVTPSATGFVRSAPLVAVFTAPEPIKIVEEYLTDIDREYVMSEVSIQLTHLLFQAMIYADGTHPHARTQLTLLAALLIADSFIDRVWDADLAIQELTRPGDYTAEQLTEEVWRVLVALSFRVHPRLFVPS